MELTIKKIMDKNVKKYIKNVINGHVYVEKIS